MERRLLLLTKNFPFNGGVTPAESYLETEIFELADKFDSVLVVATEARDGLEFDVSLPANVNAVAFGINQSRFAKVFILLKSLLIPAFGAEREKEALYSDKNRNFAEFAFCLYFVGKAKDKYLQMGNVLKRFRFVPTHIYSFWFFDTSLVARWAASQYGALSISRAHRYDLYSECNRIGYLPIRGYLLDGLDAVFPCSEDGVCYLRSKYKSFARKIKLSYLGTRDMPDKSAETRGDTFVIVSCSRVVPVKRVHLLAEALCLLDREGYCFKWIHYGDGPDLPHTKKIAASIAGNKAEFRGNVENSLLLDEYSKSHFDLFVNVSDSEGLPISVMEACGCGVPVLATDVGGTSEIVNPGENGLLLNEDPSPEDIAEQIIYFMRLDNESYGRMRRASRMIWESKFRTKRNVSIMLKEAYDEQPNDSKDYYA